MPKNGKKRQKTLIALGKNFCEAKSKKAKWQKKQNANKAKMGKKAKYACRKLAKGIIFATKIEHL